MYEIVQIYIDTKSVYLSVKSSNCFQATLTNKTPGDCPSGQTSVSPVPPSYEEATAGAPQMEAGIIESRDNDGETQFTWNDQNIRRVFIRKVPPALSFGLLKPGSLEKICSCGTLTLSLSYMTGMLSSFYNTKSVMMCLGITSAVCLLVTIFSFQTKIDVTTCRGMLLIFSMVVFISGLALAVVLPFQYVPWLDTIYAVLGAILFTMFLAFDTQLVMGNKRYTISSEEYIFATLSIYLDIIYIFSFFLQIFGTRQE
ncbi:protein lifeguard 2-like [Stigmatopora argus]